mgnify:CR=1 FL=1
MELTQTQQEIIQRLETELADVLWETTYYGETPNEDVVKLFQEGVELNFTVTLKPYEGVDYVSN